MPPKLRAIPLTPEMLPDLQSFECGTSEYQLELSEWIKGECIQDMQKRETKVWIFRTEDHEIVGYGSVVTSTWRLPHPNSDKKELSIIPMFAVHSRFQGKPPGVPTDERYSWSIFSFLIVEARKFGLNTLGLLVHDQNTAARRFYETVGFGYLSGGVLKNGCRRMVLDLTTSQPTSPPATSP